MANLEIEIARTNYQLDPSQFNKQKYEELLVSHGFLGIKLAEKLIKVAEEIRTYLWGSLTQVAVQELHFIGWFKSQGNLSEVLTSDPELISPLNFLLQLAWHLKQHSAVFSLPTQRTIFKIQARFKFFPTGVYQTRTCHCQPRGFLICHRCGKPQCVCDDFRTCTYGQAFGGTVGAEEHPLPELCSCGGSGWITTDYDSIHKCHLHQGHHPECGEEGLPVTQYQACNCGYAKEKRLVSPCFQCGTLTNTYCDLDKPAICQRCTTFTNCPKCQKLVCQECLNFKCQLCHQTGCKGDFLYFSCWNCGRDDPNPIYCAECLKPCVKCMNHLCAQCIKTHQNCSVAPSWKYLKGPYW